MYTEFRELREREVGVKKYNICQNQNDSSEENLAGEGLCGGLPLS